MPRGGRLIGLDVGTKTIGVALCDAGWSFATPDKTIVRKKFTVDLEALKTLVAAQSVVGIVVGLPLNMDSWDGYPAARDRLLAAAQRAGANLVTLSGDSHNAWAFDLTHGGRPAGVEVGGHSVTSPGFESYTPAIPDDIRVAALRAASPQLRWANTRDRGYATVALTPERVTADWHFVSSVRSHDLALSSSHLSLIHI